MPFYTFLDSDEGSTVVSQVQDTIRSVCDASSVAAASDRLLQPYEARLGIVDLGDGTVQYYFNDEAQSILEQHGVKVTSAKVAETVPTDMVNLVVARHFRHQ